MAIEYFDGFEAGIMPGWGAAWEIRTTPVRSGTYCLFPGGNNYSTYDFPSATPKKTVGFAYYTDNTGVFSRTDLNILSFYSGGTQHLSTRFSATGKLDLRRGDSNGTVIATSTQTWTVGGWHYFEMQATINDTTGTCIIRVDGVEWINFTGDTRNGGSTTDIDRMYLYGTFSGAAFYDDMYVTNGTDATATSGRADDGFLGDVKVLPLLPTGNGATSQWVGSDSDSTNNYQLVDEVPPNTTDWTGSAIDGDRDLWSVTDIPVTTVTVYAVQPSIYAQKTDAGAASLKILHRDNAGTVTAGSTQPLTTSWAWYRGGLLTAKPTGGAWTVTEANALQIGVEKA